VASVLQANPFRKEEKLEKQANLWLESVGKTAGKEGERAIGRMSVGHANFRIGGIVPMDLSLAWFRVPQKAGIVLHIISIPTVHRVTGMVPTIVQGGG
jgi:hypothetical protein